MGGDRGAPPGGTMTDDRARLIALLRERSFRVGDFVLSSGARSRYYVDARTTTTHAEGQAVVGRLGLAVLREAGGRPRGGRGAPRGGGPGGGAPPPPPRGSGGP